MGYNFTSYGVHLLLFGKSDNTGINYTHTDFEEFFSKNGKITLLTDITFY